MPANPAALPHAAKPPAHRRPRPFPSIPCPPPEAGPPGLPPGWPQGTLAWPRDAGPPRGPRWLPRKRPCRLCAGLCQGPFTRRGHEGASTLGAPPRPPAQDQPVGDTWAGRGAGLRCTLSGPRPCPGGPPPPAPAPALHPVGFRLRCSPGGPAAPLRAGDRRLMRALHRPVVPAQPSDAGWPWAADVTSPGRRVLHHGEGLARVLDQLPRPVGRCVVGVWHVVWHGQGAWGLEGRPSKKIIEKHAM